MLYFSSFWLSCNYPLVLLNPFPSFTQSPKPPFKILVLLHPVGSVWFCTCTEWWRSGTVFIVNTSSCICPGAGGCACSMPNTLSASPNLILKNNSQIVFHSFQIVTVKLSLERWFSCPQLYCSLKSKSINISFICCFIDSRPGTTARQVRHSLWVQNLRWCPFHTKIKNTINQISNILMQYLKNINR